jgi:hypothetical protein
MKFAMNVFAPALVSVLMVVAAGGAVAQDAPGNGVPQPRQGPAKKLTVQDCKDRMSSTTDAAKSAADAKLDKQCARLMKKQASKDSSANTPKP